MTTVVKLQPGEVLEIIHKTQVNTIFGTTEADVGTKFTYEDLLQKLKTNGGLGKSRKSQSAGKRFSRLVALAEAAVRKGTWSTGAKINKTEVIDKLCERFEELSEPERYNLTKVAY